MWRINLQLSRMSTEGDSGNSSLEATESNEEAIAAEEKLFDSSEEEEVPVVRKRLKQPKPASGVFSLQIVNPIGPPMQPVALLSGHQHTGWSWVPTQWMPPQATHVPPQAAHVPPVWPMGMPTSYQGAWQASNAGERPLDRSTRRKKRTTYEYGREAYPTTGGKPNFVEVLEGGEIDAGCEGKNAWDLVVRNFVPKTLDMSIVDWSKQKPHALKKLLDLLDNEFEYVNGTLSMSGFRSSVCRFMKSERSRLKVRWLASEEKEKENPPMHIEPEQWKILIAYWSTDAQKDKSAKMAVARQSVKTLSAMGRKGKTGVELQLREGRSTSPGISDLAEGLRTNGGNMLPITCESAVENSLSRDVVALKDDVDLKFGKIMATSKAHGKAIHEIKSMLRKFMRNSQLPKANGALESTVNAKFVPEWKMDGKKSPDASEVLANPILAEVQTLDTARCYHFADTTDVVEDVAARVYIAAETVKPPKILKESVQVEDAGAPLSSNPETHNATQNDMAEEGTVAHGLDGVAQKEQVPRAFVEKPQESEAEDLLEAAHVESAPRKGKKLQKSTHTMSQGKPQKRETRAKSPVAKEATPMKFKVGDEVFLMNPKAVKIRIAQGTLSGVAGEHLFHGQDICTGWWKVDVSHILQEGVPLMFPNEKGDQTLIEHTKGSSAMWVERHLKASS